MLYFYTFMTITRSLKERLKTLEGHGTLTFCNRRQDDGEDNDYDDDDDDDDDDIICLPLQSSDVHLQCPEEI